MKDKALPKAEVLLTMQCNARKFNQSSATVLHLIYKLFTVSMSKNHNQHSLGC